MQWCVATLTVALLSALALERLIHLTIGQIFSGLAPGIPLRSVTGCHTRTKCRLHSFSVYRVAGDLMNEELVKSPPLAPDWGSAL
jgi:hypothetical protein